MRTLVVGQAPGKLGLGDGGPLGGEVGLRLARMLDAERLADVCDVTNLLPEYPGSNGRGDKFPEPSAYIAALALQIDDFEHERMVLLGRGVCRAFRFSLDPLQEAWARGRWWLHVPHPSGVNRWWNDPQNVAETRTVLRDFVR